MTYSQHELELFRLLIKTNLKKKNANIFRECSFAEEAILIETVLQTNLMNKTDFGDFSDEANGGHIG